LGKQGIFQIPRARRAGAAIRKGGWLMALALFSYNGDGGGSLYSLGS